MKTATYLLLSLSGLLVTTTAFAVDADPAEVKTVTLDLGDIALDMNQKMGAADVDLKMGDNYEAVFNAYGKPLGTAHRGDLEILIYPRGQVEMKQQVVVAVKMESVQTYEKKQVRRASRIKMEKEYAEKMAAERVEKAEEKLAKVLADPAFDEKSATDQVNFWRKFKRDNPELNVDPFFKEALANLKNEK